MAKVKPATQRDSDVVIDLNAKPASDDFDPTSYSLDYRREHTPQGQTLAKKFPHLEYASIPKVPDPESWELEVCGEVENPMTWSLAELMELQQTEHHAPFHCITGWSLFDTRWQGVAGAHIVDLVKPVDTVTTVLVHGLDQFNTCVWVQDFLLGILAYGYQGKPLSAPHGYPLRFIAPPHLWQYKSCKWVTKLEFLTPHTLGFWEIRAYSDSALVDEDDRYANPFADEGKPMGKLRKEALKKLHEGKDDDENDTD